MGDIYTGYFVGSAITAQQDLFEYMTPVNKAGRIHMIVLSQSTEVGDAQEEGLSILIKRGQTTTGSGGVTATTPISVNPSAGAFSGTVKTNNTTRATGGAFGTIHPENWNVRSAFIYMPTPECRPEVAAGSRLTVELATTPADSITMSGVIYIEELG